MNVLICCVLITEAVEASVVDRRQPPPRDHLGIFEGGKGRAFTETVAIESLFFFFILAEAVTSASTTAAAVSTTTTTIHY